MSVLVARDSEESSSLNDAVKQRPFLSRASAYYRKWGAKKSFKQFSDSMWKGFLNSALRNVATPGLEDFYKGGSFHTSVERALIEFLKTDNAELNSLGNEYRAVAERLRERLNARLARLSYPESWNLGDAAALLLYVAVRLTKPDTVLETGIANGYSSSVILSALNNNKKGKLVSLDASPDVGSLVSEAERDRWKLTVLDSRRERQSFSKAISDLSQVDIFFHDSEHSYRWQRFELDTVRTRLRSGSLVIVDDANLSYAFIDFALAHARIPLSLVSEGRIVGALRW